MKKTVYKSKAKVKSISANSSATLKIKDNYFKVEAHEEREFPGNAEDIDMNKEWQFLFDELNSVVDTQIDEIIKIKNFK